MPEQREGEARQVPMAERLAAQLQEQRVGYVTENDVRRALEAMGLVLTDADALADSQEKNDQLRLERIRSAVHHLDCIDLEDAITNQERLDAARDELARALASAQTHGGSDD